jgi:hypothetical protein
MELRPEYCFECQRVKETLERVNKSEVKCTCGEPCCSKHWLNRGEKVSVEQSGKCLGCDYKAYKDTIGGM